jgi:thymidine kinase
MCSKLVSSGVPKGRLEIIAGPMFSGKTEELIRRLKRAEYRNLKVLTVKHLIDDRSGTFKISSHDGRTRVAVEVGGSSADICRLAELAFDADVIGIDEVQFFPLLMVDLINLLVDLGKVVICAGLDLDFRGRPMGIMPHLLAVADSVDKLKAVCVKCGADAHRSQRIISGKPASYNDPVILVGGEEYYEPRCRDCFEIDFTGNFSDKEDFSALDQTVRNLTKGLKRKVSSADSPDKVSLSA